MKKILILVIALISAFCLCSCCYGDVTANFNDDGSGTIDRVKGYNAEAYMTDPSSDCVKENGQTYNIDYRDTVVFDGANQAGRGEYWSKLMSFTYGDTEYQFGKMDVNYESNDTYGDVWCDIIVDLKLYDGYDIESLYKQYPEYKVLYDMYKHGNQAEKDEIIANNTNVYHFTMNMPANVYQVLGDSDNISINGKCLEINIGEILQNGGGTYRFVSTVKPENANNYGDVIDNHNSELDSDLSIDETPVENNCENVADDYNPELDPDLFIDEPADEPERDIASFPFTDVYSGTWCYDAIVDAWKSEAINGYSDNTFRPNNKLTVGQFCTVMCNFLKYDVSGMEGDHWAFGAADQMYLEDFILEDDIQDLDAIMTRQMAAYSLSRVVNSRNDINSSKTFTESDIPDSDTIDSKYLEGVLTAYGYGIIHGVNDEGEFNPNSQLTRAQLCVMLNNIGYTK